MNRTGLHIALALFAAIGLVFGLFPGLDLWLSGLFYDPATKTFPMRADQELEFVRNLAMWIAWAIAAPSIFALVFKMVRPDRPLVMPGRTVAFLLISITLSAGILTNLTFKTHWGRPRPVAVAEFNGPWQFKAWWDPRGACPKNCSFFSGEGATAYWTFAPAALTPPSVRPYAYAAAFVFGTVTSGLRIAFGGHFFTDVAIAGLVTFLVIWLLYALIYRWAWSRTTDAGVDAALTRAFWPLYRWRQKRRGRDVGPAPTPAPAV
ncbi:phosphatase PAP2 family protein [Rhodopseudomonas palustris]|uniref:phosphatase PAP2 family protein n=1 Tax=Rhodopseudomonas palustris TaxID=1076 RepID=UPI002ACED383|nr:phosphatase PAP2 family protein [Rhodopseudomonas palustris]WQG98325.1 phosphatase PAP2 family protein [Rhodopseudomonas palustris]